MGCGTSSHATATGPSGSKNCSYIQIINDKCPHIRLDHIQAIKKMQIEGSDRSYKMGYVYVSQRGYYPNALNKANQDSYLVCENFLRDQNCHFMGVFDGHGEYGDYCSHFAADQVPLYLEKEMTENGGLSSFDGAKMESVYTNAFVKANKAMHKANFDDSLSGTTGITVFVKGDMLYVANVGDSRAIIARKNEEGKLRSHPLSIDQTPFRKDERERLKKQGARIMTLDQIEGQEEIHENWGTELGEEIDEVGDPPRVWDHTLERPGCAFTRSLGDNVAELCGVYAEPEILVWKLMPEDTFVVIASDGVFEFLTSQSVVDAISKFEDPLEAAKHVVAEAYRLWLTYDDRTDDITIIIITFEGMVVHEGRSAKNDFHSTKVSTLANVENKPVRHTMSKAKRKVISESWGDDKGAEEFDFAAHATPKSAEEMRRVSEMTKANFMFQSLSAQQKEQIFQVMTLRRVKAGDMIIREGDEGDEMYIIDSGHFEVLKRDENAINQCVFTYTTEGAAFGELSLMYGKPRAASVRAKTDGTLWSIGRLAFRAVLMKRRTVNLLKSLRLLYIFKDLSVPKLQRLAECCTEETFNNKELVVGSSKVQTDTRWIVMVVLEGALVLTMKDPTRKKKTRAEGSSLGAVELERSVDHAYAQGKTKIARVPESIFLEIMGSAKSQEIIDMAKSPRLTRQVSIFSTPDKIKLEQGHSPSDYSLEAHVIVLGDYAYVGNFRGTRDRRVNSIKVISKKKATDQHMDQNLLNERVYLAAMQGSSEFIPRVVATFQNDQILHLVYDDVFECDLAHALSEGISADDKLVYCAALYSGLQSLHDHGLMHRFLNPSGVYVSATRRLPILADLRYAKKMDGSKAFTICGDPLFFPPEMVGQAGYDYAADLWSLGVLTFEIFEGSNPFGNADTEETKLFSSISAYKDESLTFTDATPANARDFIHNLMRANPHDRIGYVDTGAVLSHQFFSGLNWKDIRSSRTENFNMDNAVDTTMIFLNEDQEPLKTAVFDQY